MKKCTVVSIYFTFLLIISINAEAEFTFLDHKIPQGSKLHINAPVAAEGETVFIPVTIIHGQEKGAVLSITAGIHGYEYPPIIAAQQWVKAIDPSAVSGTIIVVHLADTTAFLGRSPFINPVDKKNLNRVFPGSEAGTLTETIAAFITEHVIEPADFFVDLHAGDASEDLIPYAAFYQNSAHPELSNHSKLIASNAGFDFVIGMQTTNESMNEKSLYCSFEAFQQGKPAIDIECGHLGLAHPKDIKLIKNGMKNLIEFLGFTKSDKPKIDKEILYINRRSKVISPFSGVFYAEKKAGDYVKSGMRLGYITSFFGEKLFDVEANSDGIILIMVSTPPINDGDTIAVIGQIH